MKAGTIYKLVAAAILIAVGLQRSFVTARPPNIEKYQAHIRDVAAAAPADFGAWVGTDAPVSIQALTLLKPNVMISRSYLNIETGEHAGLLLVHCADAHAMAGHFPLRCYPARGWKVRSSLPRDWKVGVRSLTGTEYEFTMDADQPGEKAQAIVVANCLMRPGGQVFRDMTGLSRSILGSGGEAMGSGQIQVYFDASVPRAERDKAIVAILGGYEPVIDAILATPDK
jgi:hypothetical protein